MVTLACMDATEGIFPLIAAERRRASDMFGPFCGSPLKFFLGGLLAGSFHRYSVRMSRQLAERPTTDLVAVLRANIDSRYAPPGTGPAAALTDLAVHTRDVARPLGLNTTASPEAWRQVLAFLTSPRARRGFTKRDTLVGLRLTSTDQGWSHGDGQDVRGPSEALALAISGRAVALADLTGDGLAVLDARVAPRDAAA